MSEEGPANDIPLEIKRPRGRPKGSKKPKRPDPPRRRAAAAQVAEPSRTKRYLILRTVGQIAIIGLALALLHMIAFSWWSRPTPRPEIFPLKHLLREWNFTYPGASSKDGATLRDCDVLHPDSPVATFCVDFFHPELVHILTVDFIAAGLADCGLGDCEACLWTPHQAEAVGCRDISVGAKHMIPYDAAGHALSMSVRGQGSLIQFRMWGHLASECTTGCHTLDEPEELFDS